MTEPSKISEHILQVFGQLPDKPLLGTHLGLEIKRYFPDFSPISYGCRNLREFLQRFVPTVTEVGRSGLDVIYGLKAEDERAGDTSAVTHAAEDATIDTESRRTGVIQIRPDVWKTFVSPGATYLLYVDPQGRDFRVVGRGQPTPAAPWVHLPPCPPAVHIKIARDFIASVEDLDVRSRLEGALTSVVWWVEFLRVTREVGIEKDWVLFRKQSLFEELGRTLAALGVPISAAQGSWPTERSLTTSLKPQRIGYRSSESRLRQAIVGVVNKLSPDELRTVWLPAGLLLDEVQDN